MADIRTAAQREAEKRWPDHMGKEDDDSPIWFDYSEDRANFVENALWGAAQLMPTHDQIAMTVAQFFGPDDTPEDVATAVLKLMAGLAEGATVHLDTLRIAQLPPPCLLG